MSDAAFELDVSLLLFSKGFFVHLAVRIKGAFKFFLNVVNHPVIAVELKGEPYKSGGFLVVKGLDLDISFCSLGIYILCFHKLIGWIVAVLPHDPMVVVNVEVA